MKTKVLKKAVAPNTTITIHTLDKGEYHSTSNDRFVSRGPGHVVIIEDALSGAMDWAEYDLNQDVFVSDCARWDNAGFKESEKTLTGE